MTLAPRPWWLIPRNPLPTGLAPPPPRTLRPALLSSSGSRYPASPRAWNPCPPLAAAPLPCSPAPRPELWGRALGRAGAASAPLPRPGWPREEVPLSVSGEGRPGRPEGAALRTGSAGRWEALAEGRAGERGREGGGSGPYKRRGQGGREASVRPMCRPPGAGVGAARAMRAGWAGGRRGAKRSRLGA